MTDLLEELNRRIRGEDLKALSDQVGGDEASTRRAVDEALPVLINAMRRNTKRRDGAEALANALERDHDGSILDDVSGHLQQSDSTEGNGILKHILGDKRGALESILGKKSGLSAGAIGGLLAKLAPLLMGALGKARKEGGLGIEDLGKVLKKSKGGGGMSKAGCLMSLLPLLGKFLKR